MPDECDNSASVFRNRSYRRFWLARVFSTISFQMAAVAVGWQIYAITHSTFALGMVGLTQFLPMLLLNLVVGHVADRVDRKNIMRVCQGIECGMMILLAGISLLHRARPREVFMIVGVVAASRFFESTSMQAMVPGLVSPSDLPQAIAWMASAGQTASIVGPAMGGLLYALGAFVPYSLCACMFAMAFVLTSLVQQRERAKFRATAADTLFSGVHFVRARRNILGAISLDLFVVLLGGATALLPAYARDILHTGPWALGLLRLSPALGALAMSAYLGRHPVTQQAGKKMFAAVIVFGLAMIAFALSRSLWLSMTILCISGAADVVSVVIRTSLVQFETPDHMRGRVSAINSLFIGTSNQLGEFESGVTASLFGVVPATIFGGIGSILVALLWMRWFPELRKLENAARPVSAPPEAQEPSTL